VKTGVRWAGIEGFQPDAFRPSCCSAQLVKQFGGDGMSRSAAERVSDISWYYETGPIALFRFCARVVLK